MKLAKQFALALFFIATLLLAGQAAAQGNSAFGHSHNDDKKTVSVPEPTTIALLGAAAGALGVRKIWRRRRSRQ